jgi:hypothetical protein
MGELQWKQQKNIPSMVRRQSYLRTEGAAASFANFLVVPSPGFSIDEPSVIRAKLCALDILNFIC